MNRRMALWILCCGVLIAVGLGGCGLGYRNSDGYEGTGESSGLLQYEKTAGGTRCRVVGYKGKPTRLSIPAEYDGLPVREVAASAFRDCKSLISVSLSEGITSIGGGAFAHCTGLKSVVLPDSLTEIGSFAFSDCVNLKTAEIPDEVTVIEERAFYECTSLEKVTLGAGVRQVGKLAFPSSVCQEYKDCYYLGTENNSYSFLLGFGPGSEGESLVVHSDCKTINVGAFADFHSLEFAVIPEGVTEIGREIFSNCENLYSVSLPDSLKSIGDRAFYNCKSLWQINLPGTLEHIGESVFEGCYPKSMVLPFAGENQDGTGNARFSYLFGGEDSKDSSCVPRSLQTVMLTGDTKIGDEAFYGCKGISDVILAGKPEEIGAFAFYGCEGITGITIPGSVKSIGESSFSSCSELTFLDMAPGLQSIGAHAFEGCKNLELVTLEKSVRSVGSEAFKSCVSVRNVYISDAAAWCKIAFADPSSNPLHCGGGSLYLNRNEMNKFDVPDGVEKIGAYAFYGFDRMISIIIPESVKSIGESAFEGCLNLSAVYYEGMGAEWSQPAPGSGGIPESAVLYYYSGTEPPLNEAGTDYDGNYWHYDFFGKPMVWTKS